MLPLEKCSPQVWKRYVGWPLGGGKIRAMVWPLLPGFQISGLVSILIVFLCFVTAQGVGAELKLCIYGSSVAQGVGSSAGLSWASRLSASLPGWTVVNRSVSGWTTAHAIANFATNGPGLDRPDAVILSFSLGNECLQCQPTTAGKEAVYQRMLTNLNTLVSMVRQIGAVPIVNSGYVRNEFGTNDYPYVLRQLQDVEAMPCRTVDFLGALDDGVGHFAAGYNSDALHPNSAGHDLLFNAIPLSMFEVVTNPLPVFPSAQAYYALKKGSNATLSQLVLLTTQTNFSWTVAAWFKRIGTNSGEAFLGLGKGQARVQDVNGVLSYVAVDGTVVNGLLDGVGVITTNGTWHHVAVVHSEAKRQTQFWIDGQMAANIQENLSVKQFTLAGQGDGSSMNLQNTLVRDWCVYATPLDTNFLQKLFAGRPSKSSLLFYAPMRGEAFMQNGALLNLATTKETVLIPSNDWSAYRLGTGLPPLPVNDRLGTPKNKSASISMEQLLANDTDPDGDMLTLAEASALSAKGGSVLFTNGIITYTPATDYTGADNFTYSVTDGHGNLETGSVEVTVEASSTISLSRNWGGMTNLNLNIGFAGTAGYTYAIEYTDSLTTPAWQKMTNLPTPLKADNFGKGFFDFNASLSGAATRFYRLVCP